MQRSTQKQDPGADSQGNEENWTKIGSTTKFSRGRKIACGNSVSTDHFQMGAGVLASDWATKNPLYYSA